MRTYLKQTHTHTLPPPPKNNHTTPKLLDRIHIVKKKKKNLDNVGRERGYEDIRTSLTFPPQVVKKGKAINQNQLLCDKENGA